MSRELSPTFVDEWWAVEADRQIEVYRLPPLVGTKSEVRRMIRVRAETIYHSCFQEDVIETFRRLSCFDDRFECLPIGSMAECFRVEHA